MMKMLNHKFVESIPDKINDGELFISVKYGTAVHRCCCGCGQEVVTPLSPTDWKLTYDGLTVSLSPSIGNWSFKCKSHYWIKENKVVWSAKWSEEQIKSGRRQDAIRKQRYYEPSPSTVKTVPDKTSDDMSNHKNKSISELLKKIIKYFS